MISTSGAGGVGIRPIWTDYNYSSLFGYRDGCEYLGLIFASLPGHCPILVSILEDYAFVFHIL